MAQQQPIPTVPAVPLPGESASGLRFRITAGLARAVQRPGGLPGSTSGGEGDPGRVGLARLVEDESLIPPHTGA